MKRFLISLASLLPLFNALSVCSQPAKRDERLLINNCLRPAPPNSVQFIKKMSKTSKVGSQ